ncbi:MAG: acetolactate synthase, small subunit [Acidimicrobiaceae bacterium]|nr:acetolactate synthase, small subunit [Acidimicrobiaceae bacterium]
MSAPAASAEPLGGLSRPERRHLVSLLVENKAGVLVRIAGLFSRRGFNIFSLAVAPTEDTRFSRVSVVVDLESTRLEQVIAQLEKLVNVVAITELRPEDAAEAELLLATISVPEAERPAFVAALEAVGGRVVGESPGALSVLLAGTPDEVDAFATAARPHGIVELQRTGSIALPKLTGT